MGDTASVTPLFDNAYVQRIETRVARLKEHHSRCLV